jgi:hypothetical protein
MSTAGRSSIDEHVTALSGALVIRMGDKLQAKGGKALGVGGCTLMPANMISGWWLYIKQNLRSSRRNNYLSTLIDQSLLHCGRPSFRRRFFR